MSSRAQPSQVQVIYYDIHTQETQTRLVGHVTDVTHGVRSKAQSPNSALPYLKAKQSLAEVALFSNQKGG